MKTNFLIVTIIILGMLLVAACAQQPLPSTPTDSTPLVLSNPTVSTSLPSLSGSAATPVSITDTPAAPSAGGQKAITLDDRGKTIPLTLGETFLLQLGDGYTWDIAISDESVISRVKNITVIRGAQGVYETLKAGTATLTATGDPLCRQSKPACGMPSILFEATIEVL